MVNEVEMVQELLCPFCVLSVFRLSLWRGILSRHPVLSAGTRSETLVRRTFFRLVNQG
jgi:hypothetical protein